LPRQLRFHLPCPLSHAHRRPTHGPEDPRTGTRRPAHQAGVVAKESGGGRAQTRHGRPATRGRAVGVAGRAALAGPGRRSSASACTWGSAAPHGSTSRSTFEPHLQRLAVDVVSVDAFDRCTCVASLVVVDKAEVATHACLLITDNITAGDVAKGVKQLTQIPIVKVGRESSDVDVAVGRSFIASPCFNTKQLHAPTAGETR